MAEVIGIDRIRSEERENGEKDKKSAGDDGDNRKDVAKAVRVVVAPPVKRHSRERVIYMCVCVYVCMNNE